MFVIDNQEDLNNLDIAFIQNVDSLRIMNVDYIPEGKFCNLSKLNHVIINDVKIINSGSFMNCMNLSNLEINNNVQIINDFAFHNTKIGFIPELYENTKFGVYNNLGKHIELKNISWKDINKLSELHICQEYFNVGDEKTFKINNNDYTVQIYGFNHDDLANSNGKANITFGFKNVLNYTYPINFENPNNGGWSCSDVRTHLNKKFYETFPNELRSVIKEVNKVSDTGNRDANTLYTTTDKIFIPSVEEVGYDVANKDIVVFGQGSKYEIFNKTTREKINFENRSVSWWTRSCITNSNYDFFYLKKDGDILFKSGNFFQGIVPCFCI